MKNFKKKSISREINRIFIGIFIFMLLGFISIFIIGRFGQIYYDEFISMNKEVAKLPILINKNDATIQEYFVEFNKNNLIKYENYNSEIQRILLMIDRNIKLESAIEDYVRTLRNMHDYQKKHVERLKKKTEFTPEFYEEISILKKRFSGMNRQAELTTLEFFDYSSDKYSQYNIKIRAIERYIVIFVFLISLFLVAMEQTFIKNFFQLMNKLVKASEDLSQGKFDIPDLQEDAYKEFNSLGNTFNKLKKSIVDYIEQIKEKSLLEIQLHKDKLLIEQKDKLINETKLKALQMQMNPHFLFNTLNMIGRTAMLSDTRLTNKLIEAISQILRFNLENNKNMITLEEEVAIIEKYIFIQETRFQDRMKIKLINQAKNYEHLIPPMMIQPIIENAILHGTSELDSGAEINILISENNKFLHVEVSDNGIGMSKNKIEEIMHNRNEHKNKKSIGVANVIERMNTFYNQESLFRINSELGKGTVISFTFPIKQEIFKEEMRDEVENEKI